MKRIYIIGGPPGSGKGTQADLLEKELKGKLIQAGVLLRREVARKTVAGNKIEKLMAKGLLVPAEIVNKMVFETLIRAKKDIVIDGFPREICQSCELDKLIRMKHYKVTVVEIKLEDKYVLERIIGRRSCQCGETYHVKYNPPKKTGVCDECGKKLYIREDSKPAVIKKRLQVYHQRTEPALRYFKQFSNYQYLIIGGDKSIKAVNREILKKLHGIN